ncbi:MAG: hypothetical protein AB1416_10805 [Actinomycetota bacterium]
MGAPDPGVARPRGEREDAEREGVERFAMLDGLVEAVNRVRDPRDERRLIYAKGENYRHIRHAQVLARWPVLPEPWARRIERARVAAVDRTPGPASFGR